MRRLARRLFTLCPALSLVLFGLVFAAEIFGDDGDLVLRRGNGGFAGGGTIATLVLFANNGRVGLGWTYSDVQFEHELSVPFRLAFLVTALLGLWWGLLHLPHHGRRVEGLCPACGYDLRASAERCPECGTRSARKVNL